MPCTRRWFRVVTGAATVALGLMLVSSTVAASDDGVRRAPSDTDTVPTVRLEAAGGVGWAQRSLDLQWRRMSEARAKISYVKAAGAVLELHGLYQDGERSYTPTSPVLPAWGALPIVERERRLDVGIAVGWDPLHSWAVPSRRRAGLMLVVMALDVDQFMNRVAPLVGFEPGGGVRAYARVAGPLALSAGGTYQWVTNFSGQVATNRVARGRPFGTLRYDVRLGFGVTPRTVLDLRYAGEAFEFEYERLLTHSLLFGASFDA
jgi:hypothetical protein